MIYIETKTVEGFNESKSDYYIFTDGNQKVVVNSGVVKSAKEIGINDEHIRVTMKAQKYFQGIENKNLTADQAKAVIEAAIKTFES